jgi:hypothetical protein
MNPVPVRTPRGPFPSVRAAAAGYRMPRTTLRHYLSRDEGATGYRMREPLRTPWEPTASQVAAGRRLRRIWHALWVVEQEGRPAIGVRELCRIVRVRSTGRIAADLDTLEAMGIITSARHPTSGYRVTGSIRVLKSYGAEWLGD